MSRLEQRDLEILRTLARMHFVTSAQLNATFFPSDSVGFRRLNSLAGRDLIRRHTKGAPPRSNYCAWRLTAGGVGAVRNEFKSEPVPEALDERLADLTLVDLEHREALTRIYLELIAGVRGLREESVDWHGVQFWLASVRDRADQFTWKADGTVVLRFRDLGNDQRVVPDATIESRRRSLRVFLELDRSTKPLGKIEANLERYGRFMRGPYRAVYGDGLTPWVVYLARSEARHTNVARLARSYLDGACRWKVTTHEEGASWLAELLLGEAREARQPDRAPGEAAPGRGDTSTRSVLHAAAHDLLRSTSDLLKGSTAEFDALGRAHPELIARWRRDLRALYDLVREAPRGE
jgi:hypothetical protein